MKLKNKKGAVSGVLGILVVVLLAAIAFGVIFKGETASFLKPLEKDEIQVVCDSTTTPELNIKSFDARNVGTALTEATNLYRMKGTNSWSTFTAGTAFGVIPGEDYEVVMGITTSDFVDNAYGPYFSTGKIPCRESVIMEKAVYNDEVETSLGATFYNADGTAGAETYSAGQTQTVSIKLVAGTDEFYGNPLIASSGISSLTGQRTAYPNVVCLQLNTTAWEKPVRVSFDGVEMKQVPIPLRHTGSATATDYCYEAPVIDDTLMEENRYLLRLEADGTNAPTNDGVASIYAANFFIDQDGNVRWGVETDKGVVVGTDAADTVALDFTA